MVHARPKQRFYFVAMMKNLAVRQPSFLPQPCDWPPLLVSKPDTARLLAIGRAQVIGLIADGALEVVNANGFERVTMRSILTYVDRLVAERGGAVTAG